MKFLRSFTKAGKDEKYYEEARKNMQGPEALRLFQIRVLQQDVNVFLNEVKGRRMLTETAKIALVKNKFKKDMDKLKLTICPETNKLISA